MLPNVKANGHLRLPSPPSFFESVECDVSDPFWGSCVEPSTANDGFEAPEEDAGASPASVAKAAAAPVGSGTFCFE